VIIIKIDIELFKKKYYYNYNKLNFNVFDEYAEKIYYKYKKIFFYACLIIGICLILSDICLFILFFDDQLVLSILLFSGIGIIILLYGIDLHLYDICISMSKRKFKKLYDEKELKLLSDTKIELGISLRTGMFASYDNNERVSIMKLIMDINKAKNIYEIYDLIDNASFLEKKVIDQENKIEPKEIEFKIDEYITLKLEKEDNDYKTNIYVNEQIFNHCKYVLLNYDTSKPELYEDIKNIDDLDGYYNKSLEGRSLTRFNIIPEEEFRGHCSNLQAWVENDYDTRLLHSNLSFPLLKKLVEVGCSKAKKVFKNEIIERLINGNNKNVREYLINEGYLNFFTIDEVFDLTDILLDKYDEVRIIYNNKEIIEDSISFFNLTKYFDTKTQLKKYYLDIKDFFYIHKKLNIKLKVGVINVIKNIDKNNSYSSINDGNGNELLVDVPHYTTTNIHTKNDDTWNIVEEEIVEEEDWDGLENDLNKILDSENKMENDVIKTEFKKQ